MYTLARGYCIYCIMVFRGWSRETIYIWFSWWKTIKLQWVFSEITHGTLLYYIQYPPCRSIHGCRCKLRCPLCKSNSGIQYISDHPGMHTGEYTLALWKTNLVIKCITHWNLQLHQTCVCMEGIIPSLVIVCGHRWQQVNPNSTLETWLWECVIPASFTRP